MRVKDGEVIVQGAVPAQGESFREIFVYIGKGKGMLIPVSDWE